MNPLFAPVANTVAAPEEQMVNQERNPKGSGAPYCVVSKTAEAPKEVVDMERNPGKPYPYCTVA